MKNRSATKKHRIVRGKYMIGGEFLTENLKSWWQNKRSKHPGITPTKKIAKALKGGAA